MNLEFERSLKLGLVALLIGFLAGPATATLRPAGEGVARLFCPDDGADTPPRNVVLRQEIEAEYLNALERVGLFASVSPDAEQSVARRGRMRVTVTVMPLFGPAIRFPRVRGRQNVDNGLTEANRIVAGRISLGAIVEWRFRLTNYEPFDGCVEVFAALFDPAFQED